MTVRIRYVGPSDVREISNADFTPMGLSHATVRFERANNFEMDLPEEVAALLLAQGDFEAEDVEDFGALVGSNPGRVLASISRRFNFTTTNVAAGDVILGMELLVEVGRFPVKLKACVPMFQHTVAHGQGLLLIKEGNTDLGRGVGSPPLAAPNGFDTIIAETGSLILLEGIHVFHCVGLLITAGTGTYMSANDRPMWFECVEA